MNTTILNNYIWIIKKLSGSLVNCALFDTECNILTGERVILEDE